MLEQASYCTCCDALLWKYDAGSEPWRTDRPQRDRMICDETYELLYTKKGRRRLLAAAIYEIGIDWPSFWGEMPRDTIDNIKKAMSD
jgi:hypothetical protein